MSTSPPQPLSRRALLGRGTLVLLPALGSLAACRAVPKAPEQRFLDLQAHRGGRGLAPENTLAAFDHAISLAVTTLELDIGLTADGVAVISHDTALNPDHTRDAQGRWLSATGPAIHQLTLAQLKTYDVGRLNPNTKYGQQFATQVPRDGERIPTLAELFALADRRGAGQINFNIETKVDPTKPAETASPEAITDAILAEARRAGRLHHVTLQSFDWRSLVYAETREPRLWRAWLTSPRTVQDSRWTAGLRLADHGGSVPRLIDAASRRGKGLSIWSPAFGDLQPQQVKEAHDVDLKVLPWTVNNPADMARLIDMGVDGLITDYPDRLRALMQERDLPLPPALPARSASA